MNIYIKGNNIVSVRGKVWGDNRLFQVTHHIG